MLIESFKYEVEESNDEAGWYVTTIHCRGKLVAEHTEELRGLVRPLIERGGRIVLDFGHLDYLDSSGLGAIVSLKVSSIHRGHCKLELVNLTPRIERLLSLTNLLQIFAEQVPTHLL